MAFTLFEEVFNPLTLYPKKDPNRTHFSEKIKENFLSVPKPVVLACEWQFPIYLPAGQFSSLLILGNKYHKAPVFLFLAAESGHCVGFDAFLAAQLHSLCMLLMATPLKYRSPHRSDC